MTISKGPFVGRVPNVEFEDFDTVHETILRTNPDVAKAFNATADKRNVSLALVSLRTRAGLTQKDICAKTEWDKSFVSRLEGASDRMPDLRTIARYANTCGAEVGLVFCTAASDGSPQIFDAVGFEPTEHGYFKEFFSCLEETVEDPSPTGEEPAYAMRRG